MTDVLPLPAAAPSTGAADMRSLVRSACAASRLQQAAERAREQRGRLGQLRPHTGELRRARSSGVAPAQRSAVLDAPAAEPPASADAPASAPFAHAAAPAPAPAVDAPTTASGGAGAAPALASWLQRFAVVAEAVSALTGLQTGLLAGAPAAREHDGFDGVVHGGGGGGGAGSSQPAPRRSQAIVPAESSSPADAALGPTAGAYDGYGGLHGAWQGEVASPPARLQLPPEAPTPPLSA